MSKGIIFILLGLFIDGFQAFMSFALLGIASIPGPIGGCLLGSKVAGQLGCLVLGGIGSIPIVNGFFASATIPIGIAMGIAVSFCLSVTLGTFMVSLMAFNGILYPKYLIWGGGELIPGLDIIPFWTLLAILCALKKKSEEKDGLLSAAAGLVTAAASPQSAATNVLGPAVTGAGVNLSLGSQPRPAPEAEGSGENPREETSRAPALQFSKTMDSDIKPAQKPTAANDNGRTARPANDNLIDADGRERTAYAA